MFQRRSVFKDKTRQRNIPDGFFAFGLSYNNLRFLTGPYIRGLNALQSFPNGQNAFRKIYSLPFQSADFSDTDSSIHAEQHTEFGQIHIPHKDITESVLLVDT